MPTTEDIVRVKIEVDDTVRGLAGAKRKISSLSQLGTATGAAIGGALRGAFAIAAGVTGVGLVSRGIVGLQSEIKDTEIGIASLVTALTGQDITSSLGQARTIVGQLKDDAAVGAGELSNYADGFQRILGPANRAGASLKEVRELNRLALAAGFALRGGEGLLLAPMDVVQALTAGVGERTTPIVNQLLGAIGMTNEAFNKLSKRDRFDALTKAFGTMDEGAKLMGQTFTAQTATFKDGVKDIIRSATEPIFEVWTTQLRNANEWLTDNRDKMREMAEDFGPKLAGIWESISRNPGAIAGGLGAAAAVPGVGKFAGAGGLSALGGLAGGGALAGGAILAGILSIVALGFVAVKGAIFEYPDLLTTIGASFNILGVAFGKLFDALGSFTQKGSILNALGEGIVSVFTISLDLFARGIMVFAAGLKFMGSSLVATKLLFEGVGLAAMGRFGGAKEKFDAWKAVGASAFGAFGQDFKDAFKPIRTTKVRENKKGEGEGLEKPGQGDVNIGKIEVRIQTERQDDPNRVAVSFNTVLSRANAFRKQARTAPLSPKPV